MLVQLVIAAGNEFPADLATMKALLKPLKYPDSVVVPLANSDLCAQFPNEALELLNAVIDAPQWIPKELGQCLAEIEKVSPSLVNEEPYRRIQAYAKRRNI